MGRFLYLFVSFFFISISVAFAQPANDDPCNATQLTVAATCAYTTHNNINATATTGVPGPGCANYSGGDIWFTVTVPASGAVTVDSKQGTITDCGMAFYTGANCNSLTLLSCDDDNSNNGLMPLLNASGLTPGSALYIRFWEYGNNGNGNFQICATSGPDATNQDCPNAIPICQNTYSTIVSYSGTGSIPNEINPSNSCLLSGERNDVWYTFTVNTSGILSFLITPVNMGDDYDWAVYNLTNANCTDIYANSALRVSCNYSSTPGTTGPNGGGSTNNQNAGGVRYNLTIPVTAGQTYVVNVSNFSASNDGYTIDFGASTANIFDAVPPSLVSLNQPLSCGATSITFNFSENIQCSSVQNADFTLTGPGGPYTLSNWTSTGCAIGADYDNSYTVTVSPAISTTGNYSFCLANTSGSVMDLCGNVAPPACLAFAINAMTGNVNFTNVLCNGGANGTITITANGGTAPLQYSIDNGVTFQAGNIFNGLAAGAYNVQAKDAYGCTYITVVNIAEPDPIVVNPVVVDAACGTSNGSITINVVGGIGALQYSINNGASFQASNIFNSLAAGNYDLVVKDANGCTGAVTVSVNNSTSPTINSVPSIDVSCNGGNNGSITINANGGTGALQYSINNGGSFQAGNIFNNLPAGTYDIVVEDAGGCQAIISVTINEPPPIVVNLNSNNSTCGNSNGNININANGGTGALQYSIDNGSTFQGGSSFNNLPAGNYNIVVEDANGCQQNANIVVADTPGPTITGTPATDASCNGGSDGTIIINSNGGTGAIQYSVDNGATFQPANNFISLPAGNYSIVIIDANGCQATANAVINEPPALNLNTNPSDANCNGVADGAVSVNANGGTGAIQYSIDNGATWQAGNSFNGLIAGNYTITIQDANGCQTTANFTINEPTALALNTNPVDANCNGAADGSVSVNANGGTGAIQYSIDNGATWQAGNTFNGLTAGNYTVTIQDANGCQATVNVVINEPAALALNTNPVDANCNGSSDGSITVNASGGTGVFQYSIDNGATWQVGNTFNGLSAGNYTITIEDANGCQSTANVSINEPTALALNTNPVDANCNGGSDGSISVNANGGTGAFQYSIDNGATWQAGNSFNGLTAGNYTITIQDANGCEETANASINEPTALALNANPVDANCNGVADGSVSVNANGGTGTIQYSIDNGVTWQAGNNFNGLTAGNYTVTIEDANSCQATINVSINEPSALVLNTNPVDANCNGGSDGSVSINANGGTGAFQYSIDNGATWQAGNSFNGLIAGNYTITIEDANGCQATANVVVGEPSAVTVNTNTVTATCGNSDGSITIIANGGTGNLQYSIDGGATFQNGNSFTNLPSGNYNIVVQDVNGCEGIDIASVSNASAPAISSAPVTDANCNGDSNGSVTVNANGGTGALQYSNDNGATWQVGITFNGLSAGTYNIIVEDINGCQANTSATINEPPALALNSNTTTATCGNNNGSIHINANGGTGALQYSIDNGSTFQNGVNFNNLAPGNYSLVVKDAHGCTLNGAAVVNSAPSPVISTTPNVDVTCNGGTNGSITINLNGGTGAIQYSIDNGANFQPGNIFNNLPAGNYAIMIQDANGCTDTKNVNIAEPTAIVFNTASTDASCGNSDGTLTINANGGTGTLQYSIDNGATFQNGNNFTSLLAATYNIVIQDANGCLSSGTGTVNNAAAPAISTAPSVDVTCNGGNDGSVIVNANGGTGALQYSIDNGNTFQAGNNFNGLPAGNYNVVVEDINGCQATASITINEPTPVVFNSNPTTATCGNSNGSLVINGNGGTGTKRYSINSGASFQLSGTFNNLASGNYNIVVKDASGCTASGTDFVNNAASPTIALVNTNDLTCNGSDDGTITITSNGGTGVIQYSIDNGATFQAAGSFNNLPAGNYSILIQDANGCTDASNIHLAQPAAIVFNAATVQSTCGNSNGGINLNANGGSGNYQFSIDSGLTFQQGNIFNGLPAGNYNVVIQDGAGCTASGMVAVINASSPAINAVNVIDAACYGLTNGSITINANGGVGGLEYSIDNGITFQNGNSFTNLPAGTYNIVVQDGNGCAVVSVASILEPAEITFNTASVNSTCGNATGSLTITAQGGTGALQYSINGGTTFQAGNIFNNLAATNYNLVIRDATGCEAVGIASVNNNNGPVISGTTATDLTCFGSNNGTLLINANGGTGVLQYSINNGANYQAGNSFTNLPGGAYSIVVLDGNNCVASANVVVNEPAQILFNAVVSNETCTNNNGSINVVANGGTGTLQYSNNNGTSFQNGVIFNNLPAGNYTIVVLDANGCTSSAISNVIDETAPVIASVNNADVTCNGNTDGTITVTANGGTGTIQYSIDNGTTLFPNSTFNNLAAGVYNILIQDVNGCTATINDTITEPAAIIFNSSTTTATCSNSNGSIVINANGGVGALQYSVDNGTTFQATNTFNGVNTGTYNIVVQDSNGCSTSGTAFVNNQPSPVIASTPVTNVSCNGGSNGSIHITANGGTAAIQYSIDNGTTYQSASTFNGLPAGSYQVMIHDANNCTTTAIANIIQPTAISGNTVSATASCGNSDGSLQVNANGGTGAYQYSINGGSSFQASNTFNNLLAGNYNIIIKDANGCTKSITGSVSNTSAPVIVSTPVINVSCNSGSNGTITVNSSGGTGAVQYSIDNGNNFQSGNVFPGLPAGVYSIVVKDALGCLGSTSIAVNEPAAIVFSSSATIATCGNNNASISISASGGTGSLTYSIDSGATFHNGSSFNFVAPGTYSIIVHDANNCTASGTLNVSAAPSPVINAANAVNVTCYGYNNGSITINAVGGSGALGYSIDNGATYQATNSFTNLSPGNYSILVQDTNGCTDASVAIIVQPAAIALNTNTANVNCFGGSDGTATVHVTGGTSPFSYLWSSAGGTDSTATGLSLGSYTVTITDANNCTSSVSVTINQPAVLALTSSSVNVLCHGGNNGAASVNATGGTLPYSYLWSNGATAHNITGVVAGNYSVVVTDAHLCTMVQLFTITQPTTLTSAISANAVSCFGFNNGSITVNPSGGVAPYSYLWSPAGGTSATANNLVAGTYTVIITDDNGCTLAKTDSVTSPAALAASTNVSNVTCHGSGNGSLIATASGGTYPYSYLWSTGATTSSVGNLSGGTYTVTVTDNNNCVTQKASTIAEPATLVLNVSNPATICIGQSSLISASATGGTTPYSYTWNNGTTASSQSVSPVVTTTYFVNITDANGCTAAQQSITITVNPALSVVASADAAICEQQSTSVSAVASGGSGGPYTYIWSNNASTASTTVSPMQTTTYTVQVADNCGTPVAMDSVTIIVNPLPQVAFTPLPAAGCIPLEVSFDDNSITANGSDYKWTFGDGESSTDANPVHTYYEAGTYDIKLTVTTPQGCISSLLLPDAVTAYPLPVAAFTADPPKASILHPEITFTDNCTGTDYWSWDFGDNFGTSSDQSPKYVYRDTGTYRITLMVENTYGCLDTTYGEVIIEGAFTIYVPNAFSPNGDGNNDFFTVYGIGIQKLDMFIFNRWGDKIFYSNNINNSWNGNSQLTNTVCKEDVYVYMVKLVDLNGKKHELTGNVTLVR